jgi:hypothetical protein
MIGPAMPRPRTLATAAFTGLLLVGLQACGGGSRSVAAVCPDSAIIHGLDRLYAEDAAGREVSVTLENIDGVCTHSGTRLSLDMSIDLVVDAPPGTTIPYFVVIADPAGEVLDKAFFTATLPAGSPAGPVRLRERLVQEVNGVPSGTSARYGILFGLDLPPEIALEQRAL